MVNLPPDQPNQGDRSIGATPRSGRILDFDELLAVVLAFLGIGSILWWGLSHGSVWLADAGLFERRAGDRAARVTPEPDDSPPLFTPRTFERRERPWQTDVQAPANVPRQRAVPQIPSAAAPPEAVPRDGVLVPVAPATVPAQPPTDVGDPTQPLDISDVPTTHWAYPFIKPMFDQGYLPDFPESGFQPDQFLTRAELASLLSQAFGDAPRESSVLSFSDVPNTYWAAAAIDNAVAQGFMNGYPEGDFRPDRAVPRYEVLVSLATGLGLAAPSAPDQTLQAFIDIELMPDWARSQVAAAAENALVVNYPARDQLRPVQASTRAEIVAMIHQALVQLDELPAVESQYAVP